MKIKINQIPPEGLTVEEQLSARALDLESETIKFRQPVRIKAQIQRVTNALVAKLSLDTEIYFICSRCLNESGAGWHKDFQLEYLLNKGDTEINFAPDLREEMIIDYPVKPLCRSDCKGLCPKCGKNLNEGSCRCNT